MKIITNKRLREIYKLIAACRYIVEKDTSISVGSFDKLSNNLFEIIFHIGSIKALQESDKYYDSLCEQVKKYKDKRDVIN